MKFRLITSMAIVFVLLISVANAKVGKDKVVNLVDQTAAKISKDAAGTFAKIIAGEHPFKDKDEPSLYVFIYNENVEIVAHPKKVLVGKSYKGKPDVKGKKFRDEIVKLGITKGTGWVDYSYQKPGEKGIHAKTTYLKKVKGSDGKIYIVCAGMYK